MPRRKQNKRVSDNSQDLRDRSRSPVLSKNDLVDKLKQMDIYLPSSTSIDTLRSIYDKCAKNDNSALNAAGQLQDSVVNKDYDMRKELITLQATVADLTRKIDSNTNEGNPSQTIDTQRLNDPSLPVVRRALGELPPVNIVSDKARENIHTHRFDCFDG